MELDINWSKKARTQFEFILTFWDKRNGNPAYSKKLYVLIQRRLNLISSHPEIGKLTNINGLRVTYIRDYSLYYSYIDEIRVVAIYDSRMNPQTILKSF